MDVERFWSLNDALYPEDAAEQLRERLSSLTPPELLSYQKHFDRLFTSAYRWDLWAAAYIIAGGCSDDGFVNFRYGLISRGQTVFDAALSDPESLVDVAGDSDSGFIPNESFGYVAREVYEAMTNGEMPDNDVDHPCDPSGEDWDFDDAQLCKQKLPELWGKFGW